MNRGKTPAPPPPSAVAFVSSRILYATRATTEVAARFSSELFSENGGAHLNPEYGQKKTYRARVRFSSCITPVVYTYRSSGDFSSYRYTYLVAAFVFRLLSKFFFFGEGLKKLPKLRQPQKKKSGGSTSTTTMGSCCRHKGLILTTIAPPKKKPTIFFNTRWSTRGKML